ncbi:MAG: AMP-binding protein [Candidatus Krumholzibacteriota bacterium]|nr:AMP-binding protein [Candidatus Krumholzibacteriota bacterium]
MSTERLSMHRGGKSYIFLGSDEPLIGETVGVMFERIAKTYPENEALVFVPRGERYNYAQLYKVCKNAAKSLMALGEGIDDDNFEKRRRELDFDDIINVQYTSGTTGRPKGACLTHHNILNNGYHVGETMRFTHKDRLCIPVPFYHCFGMVLSNLACVTHGATMVIPGEYFEPDKVLEAVEKERCTALHGVPTMFIAELALPNFQDYDLGTLRTGIMAEAPCPLEVLCRGSLSYDPENEDGVYR